ncbi:MAG: DUF1080 domain-containing protein [Acidobacteriia bacterium]|nr:DUF1080 domain-containing protein [Terriglobia bacterium]
MRILICVWFLLAAGAVVAPGRDVVLFDGKSLNGWNSTGGAQWKVENGELVGRQGEGGVAGDLFTNGTWADFDLEAEWKMRFPGNSGIWFRFVNPKEAYQADIIDQASHPGVYTGSLYCAGKMFIAENRDAATVSKDGWNRMRIRAAGDEIVIWQNGKEVIRVRDGTFRRPGSVGIQVHAGKAFEGMEIRVKNIRLKRR